MRRRPVKAGGYSADGQLADLFAEGEQAVKRAGRRMAEAGGERMAEIARERVPVQHGRVRSSIKAKKPVVAFVDATGRRVWESGAESHHFVAKFLESGTGIFKGGEEIGPKRKSVLSWLDPSTGERLYARSIRGQKGHHYMALAVAQTEAEFHRIVAPALARFKAEVES